MLSAFSTRKRRTSLDAAGVARARISEISLGAQQTAPSSSYLSRAAGRPLISERQREKVVKYVNELAEDFELCVQTGSLACNYFDRYLASYVGEHAGGRGVPLADKRFIQMCASTCLLIAAKFSDRKLPPLSELEKVHHGRVQPDEFAALELRILQGLQWKLHVPLPHVFIEHLRVLCPGAPFTTAVEDRANFFIDLSVYGYHFLAYMPTAIAAAAMLTAWKFSEETDSVSRHLRTLAAAVELEPYELTACVNQLVRYYGSCFPESADKVQHAALFIPISEKDQRETPTELRDTPTADLLDVESPPEQPDTPTDFGAGKNRSRGASSRADGASSVPPPPALTEETAKPTAAVEAGSSSASSKSRQQLQPDPMRATPESIMEVDKVVSHAVC